jgi:hypothetical protein
MKAQSFEELKSETLKSHREAIKQERGMGSASSSIVHVKTYSLEKEIPPGFPVQSKKVGLTELERRILLCRPVEVEVEGQQGITDGWVQRYS